MTDRELLEAAAKAAGLDVRCVGNGEPNGAFSFYAGPEGLWWNPLTDDGDALRLAVKLKIEPSYSKSATWVQLWSGGNTVSLHNEPHNDDPCAATRRAIVRAAAEMGKCA